jgi:hypothetical protein
MLAIAALEKRRIRQISPYRAYLVTIVGIEYALPLLDEMRENPEITAFVHRFR